MSDNTQQHGANINAILPYFGAKRVLAPAIIQELGNHTAYWEPFCGSMAVLLINGPSYGDAQQMVMFEGEEVQEGGK